MNTLEFLQTILPSEGVFYLALIDRKTGFVQHKVFSDLETMADAAIEYDQGDKYSVYHACASYQNPSIEVDGKKKYRVPENWDRAKSFWIDLDCGEDKVSSGAGYATKRDAAKAILGFCKANNVPVPMLVDSGNGVHCYWPLTKAIKPEVWRKVAYAFKAVLAHHNILADPTCTADFSRILRPVGTLNKKREGKPVSVAKTCELIDPAVFAAAISALIADVPKKSEPPKIAVDLNDDLTSHLAPSIPAYAEEVANRCAQVAEMRDTEGDVNYEHWRGVIGIIKHCEEGIDLAIKWSAKRAETGHSQNDVQTRYDTWNSGPTTCEHFSKCNPKGCEGCPSAGKIKSPIMLGRVVPEPKVEVVEAKVDGTVVGVEVPELPKGYGFDAGVMCRFMKDKDDIMHAFAFAANLFYPTHRVCKETGEFSLLMRMHLPDNRTRDFEIDTSTLASRQKLIEALAKYELIPTNNKDAEMHLTAYVRDSLEKLKREAEEINTMTSFGWKNDFQSFLIGDRLYHSDGTVRRVLVGGYAKDKSKAFPAPRGTMEQYAKALNFMYNRPGMEYRQYVVASGFGSVLTPLSDSLYRGLLVAVIGGDTSKGKTTLCRTALYAFGNADEMSLKREEGATQNARNALMGTYQNIPLLMDELTHIDAQEFSKLAYTVSLGEERERLTTGKGAGTRFAEKMSWALSPYVTANTDLHALLAAAQGNTQAEAVRMIQINIDRYAMNDIKASDVQYATKQMELNMGSAGDVYLRYVVTHRDEALELMNKWGRRIEDDVPDVKFRYYRFHLTCTMAATEITNHLGITQFNLESMYQYAVELFRELETVVKEQNSMSPEDALNAMINELSPRIISTVEYRDGRDGRGPELTRRIVGMVAGRFISGSPNVKTDLAGRLYISRKEASEWCHKQRLDLKAILDYAQSIGIYVPLKEKFTLGRGTEYKTGNVTCICIDYSKLEGFVGGDLVSKFTVHQGKKGDSLQSQSA